MLFSPLHILLATCSSVSLSYPHVSFLYSALALTTEERGWVGASSSYRQNLSPSHARTQDLPIGSFIPQLGIKNLENIFLFPFEQVITVTSPFPILTLEF